MSGSTPVIKSTNILTERKKSRIVEGEKGERESERERGRERVGVV
jgi:hypothetical protein